MLNDFKAYQLAKQFYQVFKFLKLPVYLKDQLLRASSSTVLNLTESSGERTDKERDRFYTIARGSFLEARSILDLEAIQDPTLQSITDQLGAVLFKLCRIAEKRGKFSSNTKPSGSGKLRD